MNDKSYDILLRNEDLTPLMFFSNQLTSKLKKTQEIARDIYSVVIKESPMATAAFENIKSGSRFVVDMSEDLRKKINSGEIKLVQDCMGDAYAQVRNTNGRFGKKIPIKKEQLGNVNYAQLANAMQMQAIQSQIESITNQLNVIDISVRAVIEGQQNDRLAGLESGKNLYLESLSISDDQLRMDLKVQAIKTLSDAYSQLRMTMQSDISFLKNKEYKIAKGKQAEQIDGRMRCIHQSFEAIHNITLMKAGIYCNEEEYDAMNMVLNDYSSFVERVVTDNANLLSQWDKTDDGTNEGVWKTRAELKLDKVMRQYNLGNEQIFYISILTEDSKDEND